MSDQNTAPTLSSLPTPPEQFFNEMPTWNAASNFSMRGRELEVLSNFLNLFAPVISIAQRVITDGLKDGTIVMNYTYAAGPKAGQPVPQEELDSYFTQREEYIRKLEETVKSIKTAPPQSPVATPAESSPAGSAAPSAPVIQMD